MTAERVVAVGAGTDAERLALIADIQSAAARAQKADLGDRLDAVRYEMLSTQLEAWAFEQMTRHGALAAAVAPHESLPGYAFGDDPLTWLSTTERAQFQSILAQGGIVVTLALPLEPGSAPPITTKVQAPEVAETWKSPDDSKGSHAVLQRFEAQLEAATATSGRDVKRSISPSGIQNAVVTRLLRQYVHNHESGPAVLVDVEYRDGSKSAYPLALRSLQLSEVDHDHYDLELHFALISIRHTEMDVVVDGAWFRNTEISRPRPAAQTDDIAYSASREQLAELTDQGNRRVKLYMYQTGLETAVVGFYRAVTDHLRQHPTSLSVVPMFFRGGAPKAPGVVTEAPFEPGVMWSIGGGSL